MAMSRTKVYTRFADLTDIYTPRFNPITIRPIRRHYLSASDAVYDFTIGHDFAVSDHNSPFHGCLISVLDKRTLIQHGYTHATISYNYDREVEIKL
jgi:hypothetical protein